MKKQMKNKAILCILFATCSLFTSVNSYSQGAAINTTGASADNSAIFDVSSSTQGMLIPRMTEAQKNAIVSPANGLLIYQTDNTNGFWYFNGTGWVQAIGPAGTTGANGVNGATGATGPTGSGGIPPCTGAPPTPGAISGNIAVCTGGIGIYFVAPVADATSYTWTYGGTGATISGTGNSVVISFSSFAASGNLTVTAINNCGTSSSSPALAVTVNVTPHSNFSVNTTTPSWGESISFTPVATDNQLYFWTLPGVFYSTSQSTTMTWYALGIVNATLTVTKNGCNSTSTIAIGTATPSSGSKTYTPVKQAQVFVVPPGVSSVTLDVYGALGGNNSTYAGKGGEAKGTLAVIPGQILNIYVGGCPLISGNWPAGGESAYNAGDGSSVRTPGGDLADRIIVAGGGGSPGYVSGNWNVQGGDGGGNTAVAGSNYASMTGGGGGTQSAGGAAGTGGGSGTWTAYAGSFGPGGYGGCFGASGGGGYYGGGGGCSDSPCNNTSAGGGGSNYLSSSLTSTTNIQGVNTGDGKIIITW